MNKLAKIIAAMALVGMGATIHYASRTPQPQTEKINTVSPQKPATIDDYVLEAVMQIESNGNPRAERYESHVQDTSYGLMQILGNTARELEKKYADLPRLGTTPQELRESLFNPEINKQYGKRLLDQHGARYQDFSLAVAAYNAGHLAPRNARVQQQLNDLLQTSLDVDGSLGPKSKEVVIKFQQMYNLNHPETPLEVDSKLGNKTYAAIQQVWQQKFPGKENPKGIIPQNGITPRHVKKFEKILDALLSKGSQLAVSRK